MDQQENTKQPNPLPQSPSQNASEIPPDVISGNTQRHKSSKLLIFLIVLLVLVIVGAAAYWHTLSTQPLKPPVTPPSTVLQSGKEAPQTEEEALLDAVVIDDVDAEFQEVEQDLNNL